MTNDDLVGYLKDLGHTVEILEPAGRTEKYIVIKDFMVHGGARAGQCHDVAIQWSTAVPYVAPAALHVRPFAVAMGTGNSQPSPIGPEWQYLSRVLRVPATPSAIVVHVCTVFAQL